MAGETSTSVACNRKSVAGETSVVCNRKSVAGETSGASVKMKLAAKARILNFKLNTEFFYKHTIVNDVAHFSSSLLISLSSFSSCGSDPFTQVYTISMGSVGHRLHTQGDHDVQVREVK